jgi:carbamoyl-phosphate synthase small subunit
VGTDYVKAVTCAAPYEWTAQRSGAPATYHVVVIDYGVKYNILRQLASRGCYVNVVPASMPAGEILAMQPDGVVLSNGPADPAAVTYGIETIRGLIGRVPMLGICLGHQLLGLAFGGKTYKLKFGHHGGNHPVKDLASGKVEITTQNHGFAVDLDSIPDKRIELSHVNLNDRAVEGMRHRELPIFGLQYHPEASPGPHDARHLFRRFLDLLEPAHA